MSFPNPYGFVCRLVVIACLSLLTLQSHAQSLVKLEYFIDKDPGVGKGTSVSFSGPKDTILKTFTIPSSGLSSGAHYIHVRVLDSGGLWSPWQFQMFHVQDTINPGPIDKVEYFVDDDPGVAKGTAQSISSGDTVKTLISQNTSALSSGFHFIHVRAKMAHGFWSPWQLQMIHVQDTTQMGTINKVEYFTGKDPGVAKATNQSITAGDTVFSEISQSTSNLPNGFNFVHVRAKISNGYWSPWQLQMIHVQDTITPGPVNKIEYFVGKDPGVSKATAQTITVGDTVITQINQSTSALNAGFNFMHVRAKIANGSWSPWQLQMFHVQDTTQPGPINNIEYFVDKDPGTGKANKITFTSADTVKKDFSYNTAALSRGQHFMHVRARNRFGYWSPYQLQMFFVESPHDTAKIISFKYSIDSSLMKPAYVKTVLLTPPADTFKRTLAEKTDTALKYGNHFFRGWAQVSNRFSSTWHKDTFTVIDCPMLDTAVVSVSGKPCSGDTLTFRQDITKFGIWSKDTFNFRWSVNGSLLSTLDSFRYRHSGSSDSFKLRFSFNRKSDSRCKGFIEQTFYIYKSPKDTFRMSICKGDSAKIHNVFRKSAGSYLFSGTSQKGCDSFATVILTVTPSYRDTLRREICQGDSIFVHGKYRKTAGTYLLDSNTTLGCDSVVTVLLKVNPIYQKHDSITLCQGDTAAIHGKFYTKAGVYSDSFVSAKGCDSLFKTTIIVNPTYDDTATLAICREDSALIHGVYQKLPGIYTFKGSTTKGCDSLSTIILKVNPIYNDTFYVEICNEDSLFVHGKFEKTAGVYTLKTKTHLGCDSIVSIILKTNPIYFSSDTFEICNGDTLRIHGNAYHLPGLYTDKFKSIKGCDSIHRTLLIVNPTYNNTINRGLCGGDSFYFDGQWRKQTGVYIGKFFTDKGCDSTVTLHLRIDSIINTNDYPEICLGDSMLIGGIFRKTPGTYFDIYTAFKGCDSLVTRYLKIIPRDTTYLTQVICQRETVVFHGQNITSPGTYKAILKNRRGCDSVLFLSITQRPENRHIFSNTVCYGEGFFAGNSIKFGSGTFHDTLTGANGCDSVVIYTQTERPRDTFALETSICSGDSIFTGNSWKKTAGIFTEKLTNRHGCDSFVSSKITLRPVSFTALTDTICFGTVYNFLGTTFTEPGIYRKILTNAVGCDSTVELNLFRRPQFIPKVISLSFAVLGTDKPYNSYQWYKNRIAMIGETGKTLTVSSSGIYDVSVTDSLGCGANSWDDILNNRSYDFATPIQVYPNPANDMLYIQSTVAAEIDLFNSAGVHLSTQKINADMNTISTSALPEGVYQIRFRLHQFVYSTSIVVLH